MGTNSCSADVNLTYSPTTLSPPNHKLVPITITGTDTDQDSDTFTMTVTSITSDQTEAPGGGCGSPNNGPDFTGVGNTVTGSDSDIGSGSATLTGVALRAERCAEQGPRHYDITVQCSESNTGTVTSADLTVTVP